VLLLTDPLELIWGIAGLLKASLLDEPSSTLRNDRHADGSQGDQRQLDVLQAKGNSHNR
jgi:hypothetical protein